MISNFAFIVIVSVVTDDEGSSVPSSPEGVGPVPGNGREGGEEEGEEWEQVGPKNKSIITRQVSLYSKHQGSG